METWDLLLDGEGPGAWQMALDEAMMTYVRERRRPILRLYRFSPRALSLGRGQKVEEIYLPGVREIGADLVRRPSGGKAVLHDREVTYAFAAPADLFPASVVDSYRMIAGGLLRGIRSLGVEAAFTVPEGQAEALDANCFIHPSVYEISVGGKKAIGSAQVRTRGALLQHGAIPLVLDAEAWSACFAPPGARQRWAEAMAERATGLFQDDPSPPSYEALSGAVVQGFQEHFDVLFTQVEGDGRLRDLARERLRGGGIDLLA